MNQENEINLADIFKSLLRRWWIILLTTIVFAVGGFVLENLRYTPQYTATVKMYVNNNSMTIGNTKLDISSGDISASQSLVKTYREILLTQETYEKTMAFIAASDEDLSKEYDFKSFLKMIETGSLNGTEIMYISVTCTGKKSDKNLADGKTPDAARDACLIADAIQDSLVERIESVINSTTASKVEGVHRYSVSECDDMKTAVVTALLGLVMAAGICVVVDVFINDKLQDEEWLSNTFGEQYSVLAVVPNGYQTGGRKYKKYGAYYKKEGAPAPTEENGENSFVNINYAATEAYNRLRTNISYSLPEKTTGAQIIAVTSSSPSEGKTFTSSHLAYAMAKEGNKVLLVDCDMRRPAVGTALQQEDSPGLSDFLVGKAKDVIRHNVMIENMSVIFAGVIPPNPLDLLTSDKLKDLLETESKNYDYIILDLPPVLAVADPVAVAKYADAMVVVTKHNSTRKKYILSAIKQLKLTKVRILGFVYNDFRLDGGRYSSDSKYYYADHYNNNNKK